MPLRLLLVRHGQSSFNVEHRVQGRDDRSSLTELGQRQATASGAALRPLSLQAVYSSPLRRAEQTATLLLAAQGGGLIATLDDDLLEVDLEPWSGLLVSELRQRFPEQHRLWRQSPEQLELRRGDGSVYRPIVELMAQARRFLDRLLQRFTDPSVDETVTVLVVAHNAILRCLILNLLSLPGGGFQRLRLDNASLSVFNIAPGGDGAGEVQIESLNGTAHLGEGLPAKGAGPRLLLVRHGETDWNRQGRFQGQIDIPLNPQGRHQAEAAGRCLTSEPIQRAYTSSMARPRQTAELILANRAGIPLTSLRGLVEIGHGLWEGELEEAIARGWPELLAAWKRAPDTVQMPEGENLQEVWDRSISTIRTIAGSLADSESALVVAHDAVNKTILCALLGLSPADIWMVKQGNGGVSVIDFPADPAHSAPVVTCLNLTAHLGGVLDRTAAGAL
ncbi:MULTISPECIES: histidine phosphatase family protein [unclassified Synechococcus]|uniref:histidine phosphatase family protein n=1 Tax=unclassified Synechococcus TaxID=2626047 RepID=UPI0021A38115|nr:MULTISPECIES: histidine phosphatase family protein [unclassified Synechococcus]MCT0213016.1 histidine phosphatase family protein [Synechococcus sp. CS-1326]MCT0232261.1 histidine phosphatase family protein [Synechococcus sp. CS-1327]